MSDLEVVSDFCSRLDSAGIRYLIGGSMASSVWGNPRMTNDADLSVWISPDQVPALLGALTDPYHLEPSEVDAALRSREAFRSFKVLHLDWVFGFDCFLQADDAWSQEVWERRREVATPQGPLLFLSPEAIILTKLRWYVLGNRVSDRQWNDVCQIIEVQSPGLDADWLRRWAEAFHVGDLLEAALAST